MPKHITEMTAGELNSQRRTIDELAAWGEAQPDNDFDRFNDELVEAAVFAPRGEFVLELDIEEDDDQPARPDAATFGGGFYRP